MPSGSAASGLRKSQYPIGTDNTFSPVESITTLTGPSVLDSAAAISRSALRRERVV